MNSSDSLTPWTLWTLSDAEMTRLKELRKYAIHGQVSITEWIPPNEDHYSKWVQQVHTSLSQLSKSTNKLSILHLVRDTLLDTQLSLQTVPYLDRWCSLLLAMLSTEKSNVLHGEVLSLVDLIFGLCLHRNEMVRDIVGVQLPKVILLFLNNRKITWMPVIQHLLTLYPSISKPYADRIGAVALDILLENESLLQEQQEAAAVTQAARLMASTWSCHGKQSTEQQFLNAHLKMLATIHAHLSVIFSTVDEEPFRCPATTSAYDSPSVCEDTHPASHFPRRLRLITHLFTGMKESFKLTYPSMVMMPIQSYMDLLERLFNLSRQAPMKRNEDAEQFELAMTLVPELHWQAMDLLQTLLIVLKGYMRRYTSTLSLFVPLLLKESAGLKMLRKKSNQILSSMVSVLGGSFVRQMETHLFGSMVPELEGLLLELRLSQIQSVQATIQHAIEQPSRKRRKVHTTTESSQEQEKTKSSNAARSWHKECVVETLDFFDKVLAVSGQHIRPMWRDKLISIAVNILLSLAVDTTSPQAKRVHGYPALHDSIRRGMYRLLKGLLLAQPYYNHPALAFAIKLFRQGLCDSDDHVRRLCLETLSLCDAWIHPKLPPIIRKSTLRTFLQEEEKADQYQKPETGLDFMASPLFDLPEMMNSVHQQDEIENEQVVKENTLIETQAKETYWVLPTMEEEPPVEAVSSVVEENSEERHPMEETGDLTTLPDDDDLVIVDEDPEE